MQLSLFLPLSTHLTLPPSISLSPSPTLSTCLFPSFYTSLPISSCLSLPPYVFSCSLTFTPPLSLPFSLHVRLSTSLSLPLSLHISPSTCRSHSLSPSLSSPSDNGEPSLRALSHSCRAAPPPPVPEDGSLTHSLTNSLASHVIFRYALPPPPEVLRGAEGRKELNIQKIEREEDNSMNSKSPISLSANWGVCLGGD